MHIYELSMNKEVLNIFLKPMINILNWTYFVIILQKQPKLLPLATSLE